MLGHKKPCSEKEKLINGTSSNVISSAKKMNRPSTDREKVFAMHPFGKDLDLEWISNFCSSRLEEQPQLVHHQENAHHSRYHVMLLMCGT